ncbi:MAG: hypothetical protein Q8L53_10390 [Aestuariivirga sp.]|nr:hypothetical protein [Aestuariivirga sp.]
MKKLSLSLFALAAISTSSLASQNGYDLRDSDTYFGKYSTQLKNAGTKTHALAVIKRAKPLTNFERMMKNSEESKGGNWSVSKPQVK